MTTPEIKTIIEQVNDNESLEAARPKVAAYLRDCEEKDKKYVSDRWRVVVGRYVDSKKLSRSY